MKQPTLPLEGNPIRLAMLGMVDGNGHPYSWSAMFNGYDADAMQACPYAAIADYLGKQPRDSLQIPEARVTHVWTDDPKDAESVARCSLVPNIVDAATDVIGEVDAVIIATDKGHEHVERARPFVEAGLPVFVDKPLVDNAQDLQTFKGWLNDGAAIMSSSCMRYAKEYMPYRASCHDLGELRWISMTMCKTWERYGIHALEGVYPITGPGYLSCRNTGSLERNVIHLKHATGTDVTIATHKDMFGSFGCLQLCGTSGSAYVRMTDMFYAFRAQLVAFIDYLQTGRHPFPFSETEELMKLVIAGIISREEGGREVLLEAIK